MKLTCKRCGYTWEARKEPKDIKECPNCKSRYWNRDKIRKEDRMKQSPIAKEVKKLQKELSRFDDWVKANPTENPVANSNRAEYRIVIKSAIKKLE